MPRAITAKHPILFAGQHLFYHEIQEEKLVAVQLYGTGEVGGYSTEVVSTEHWTAKQHSACKLDQRECPIFAFEVQRSVGATKPVPSTLVSWKMPYGLALAQCPCNDSRLDDQFRNNNNGGQKGREALQRKLENGKGRPEREQVMEAVATRWRQ
jgi:hypothetical protein